MLVVVSGAPAAVEPVRQQFEAEGHAVASLEDAGLDGQQVGAYVQLPQVLALDGAATAGSLTATMGKFLADGLLSRFSQAAQMLPHLDDQATVVLVGGNTPVPGTAVDDQNARLALLRVLAHALRAEEAPGRLRVRVLPHGAAVDDVVNAALGRPVSTGPASTPPASGDSELSYEDWRTQVLGLATVEF